MADETSGGAKRVERPRVRGASVPKGREAPRALTAADGVPEIALAPTLADLARDIPWAVAPRAIPPGAPLSDPAAFFNRELSFVDFNWRVLYQALDPKVPLAERVFFLSIAASNLDDFIMKRVGGLKRQVAAGVTQRSTDGRAPAEQLSLIRPSIILLQERMSATWSELEGRLSEQGVVLHDYEDLGAFQRHLVSKRFRSSIYPILTPLALESGERFPNLSSLGLRLAVVLRHPGRGTTHIASVNVTLMLAVAVAP